MVKLKGRRTASLNCASLVTLLTPTDEPLILLVSQTAAQAELLGSARSYVYRGWQVRRHERRNIQTGVAQETFCDDLYPCRQAAEPSTSEPTNGRFAIRSMPCRGAVFAQRAVNDRETPRQSVPAPPRVPGIERCPLYHARTVATLISEGLGDVRRIVSV